MKAFRQLVTATLILPASMILASCSSAGEPSDDPAVNDPGVAVTLQEEGTGVHTNAITEAPTGFDNKTNGFNPNNLSAADLQAAMDAARDTFSEVEAFTDAISPTFNTT